MVETRVCEYCGKTFGRRLGKNPESWSHYAARRFCSHVCADTYRRGGNIKNETKTCEYCGKAFERKRHHCGQLEPHFSIRKFCSRECSIAGQRGKSRRVARGPLCEDEVEYLRLNYRTRGREVCAMRLGICANYLTRLITQYKQATGREINYVLPGPPPPVVPRTRRELLEDWYWALRRVIHIMRQMERQLEIAEHAEEGRV